MYTQREHSLTLEELLMHVLMITNHMLLVLRVCILITCTHYYNADSGC